MFTNMSSRRHLVCTRVLTSRRKDQKSYIRLGKGEKYTFKLGKPAIFYRPKRKKKKGQKGKRKKKSENQSLIRQ